MRLLLVLVAVLALCEARRLGAKNVLSAKAPAGTAADPVAALEAKVAPYAKASTIPFAKLKASLFPASVLDNSIAQGRPPRRIIGSWVDEGVRKGCTNGVCGSFGPDGAYRYGNKGSIVAIYNAPQNGGKIPESITFEFKYWWPSCQIKDDPCMTHLTCKNVGTADETPCEFRSYMDASRDPLYGSTPELWNSAPSGSEKDAASIFNKNHLRVTDKGVYVRRDYKEARAQTVYNTIRFIYGDFASDAMLPANYGVDGDLLSILSKLKPEAAAILKAAKSAPILTTGKFIRKFFTDEGVSMAKLTTRPRLRTVFAGYQTAYLYKVCDGGVCGPWTDGGSLQVDGKSFGGEGTIGMDCDIPANLDQANCKLTWTMRGRSGWEYQSWAICPKVGNAVTSCNEYTPSYFVPNADGLWIREDFARGDNKMPGNKLEDSLYITDDRIVQVYRWRAPRKIDNKLVYTQLVSWSTPLNDFDRENAVKATCLSKATPEAILKLAAEKKGLKNKIVLQKNPLVDLIKNAPYKDKGVEEAILKIKGIGPVNVLYVSFWYNFYC